jgi:hypothetical protein
MRKYFQDIVKAQEASKNIMQELKDRELLCKESFLKKNLRKEVKRIIRENIIKSLGLVDGLDDVVEKIFMNLEDEYG